VPLLFSKGERRSLLVGDLEEKLLLHLNLPQSHLGQVSANTALLIRNWHCDDFVGAISNRFFRNRSD